MKNGTFAIGIALTLATLTAMAADDAGNEKVERYSAYETVFDAFGSASIGQHTIDHFSGANVRHNARLGAGVGLSYFLTRYVGFGADAYTESTQHSLVDSASANLLLRLPLGQSGFAPYAFGGGGREFDLNEAWFTQAGGGIEYRFSRSFGIFTDARYVLPEKTRNYGLARAGIRLAF